MKNLQVPVLTYHAGNITGNSYQNNDRMAFQSDLYTLHAMGFRIIPLLWLAEWLNGQRLLDAQQGPYVALSCDDGLDHDFIDGTYFEYGPQISLHHILSEFQKDVGVDSQPNAHLTAFVIASATARTQIADKSLKGEQLLNDYWWPEANRSPLMGIENHSWDHRHPDIYETHKASFIGVDTDELAEQQIIKAKQTIDLITGGESQLFCYPWGQYNDFLWQHFLPKQGENAGILAAFTCEAKPVNHTTSPWLMPRYVCGHDWHSPQQLQQLLANCQT